jgi:hypothetical protein
VRIAALFCLVVALGSAGLVRSGPGTASRTGSAAAVARAYVQAYSRRDGKAICAASSPELRRWFVSLFRKITRRSASCPRAATAFIGQIDEGGQPVFQRLEVLAARTSPADEFTRVTVATRYHYKDYPKPTSSVLTDQIYLVRRPSGWQVVKPGAVFFDTNSVLGSPMSLDDPPITDAEAHKPAPQPRASFPCASIPVSVVSDAAGDAPSAFDVRRATASVNPDGSVCFTFTFGGRPQPGTTLALDIKQPVTGGVYLTVVSVNIGHRGRLDFLLHASKAEPNRFRGGWIDGRLEVLWLAQKGPRDGHHPLRFDGSTRTLQEYEPLIRHPAKLIPGDRFGNP